MTWDPDARPIRHLGELDRERQTVTIDRMTVVWGSVAALLLWIASVAWAYEAGRTDAAWMVARDAEQRAYDASLEVRR